MLVHGTRFTRGQWQPQLAALAAEFPVAAVDLPGRGGRAAEPWSLDRAADVVAEAGPHLDAGPALVVGHSLRGYVSLGTSPAGTRTSGRAGADRLSPVR